MSGAPRCDNVTRVCRFRAGPEDVRNLRCGVRAELLLVFVFGADEEGSGSAGLPASGQSEGVRLHFVQFLICVPQFADGRTLVQVRIEGSEFVERRIPPSDHAVVPVHPPRLPRRHAQPRGNPNRFI